MQYIFGTMLLTIFLLYLLSGKEEGDPFAKMASFLHKKSSKRRQKQLQNEKIQKEMERLHPGESAAYYVTQYEISKLRLFILVVTVGSLFGLLFVIKEQMERKISPEGMVKRGIVGEENTEIILDYEVEGIQDRLTFSIPAREYTEAEKIKELEHFKEELRKGILGNNTDFQHVCSDLKLLTEIEGYPFEVSWKLSDYEWMDSSGKLKKDVPDKLPMDIRGEISLGNDKWEVIHEIVLIPPTYEKEVALQKKLESFLKEESYSKVTEDSIQLPTEIDGQKIIWKEPISMVRYGVIPGLLLIIVLLSYGMDRDLVQKRVDRQNLLKRDYPLLLHKFILFMGAGLTVRGTFMKMAESCEKKKGTPLYEEILLTVRELQAGKSESVAYENFGKRTGVKEYKRFCTLLIQNLKKGNHSLLSRLQQESEEALSESINQRKKKGEETESKLLLPMIMMLVVVMLLIMFPAITSFQI